jgi:hypothetical protein
MSVRTAIVRRAIDVAALLAEVKDTANGATIAFLGQVREVNEGRAVTGIEYSAYGDMAERELAAIARECAATFGTTHLVAEWNDVADRCLLCREGAIERELDPTDLPHDFDEVKSDAATLINSPSHESRLSAAL